MACDCFLCETSRESDEDAYHNGYADGTKDTVRSLQNSDHARTLASLEAMETEWFRVTWKYRASAIDRQAVRARIAKIRALRFALAICG